MNQMNFYKTITSLSLGLAALSLVSCAGGPSYSEVKSKLPPIAKGNGRVFVYRTSALGAAVRPEVKIDDQVVGKSESRGFFYTDQKAGPHKISIKTETSHENTINVTAGQPAFVACNMQMGVFVGRLTTSQVTTSQGESDIQDCGQTTN